MKSILLLLFCFASSLCSIASAQGVEKGPTLRFSTPEEIQSEFNSVPCKNGDRLAAVKALFAKMGAKPEEISVEKARGIENVVVRVKAATGTSEKIVIGAHYDKVPDGCGAIDNWSGVVAMAHIYRTLKDIPLKKNIIYIAFGMEEKGLVGSSGLVGEIKKEQLAEYCAMINIDSLGMGIPQTLDNVSSKKLIDFTEALAKEMKIPFAHARIDNASSDSAAFIRRKIPAVTIHELTDDWPKILHSRNDQSAKVNFNNLYTGYRLILALLARVDAAECQAFREDKEKK